MPTPGFALAIVGVVIVLIGVVLFHGCTGESLLFVGIGILAIGIGISLAGGLPALYFLGPVGAILMIVGVVLANQSACWIG